MPTDLLVGGQIITKISIDKGRKENMLNVVVLDLEIQTLSKDN